jgi:hypothetical protein
MSNLTHVLAGTLTACLAVSAFADDKPQAPDLNSYQPARAGGTEMTNLGEVRTWTFQGHELDLLQSGGVTDGGPTWLYGPSEGDDPAMRADIDALTGGSSDYFDTRAATPDVATLSSYDVVVVWANFAFLDNVAYGNNLGQAADNGTTVILGAFCTYTSGNFLSGDIMTAAYCPVVSPTGSNHFFNSAWSGDNPCGTTAYDGLAGGSLGDRFYRDFLVLQGAGVQCGTDLDAEITLAGTNAFGPGGPVVAYFNGAGGNFALGTGPDHNLWLANGIAGLAATPVDCVCDGVWSVGDRVVKSAETGSGGPAVGSLGTVVSGAEGFPPLLVSWDGFAGHDGNGFAICPPATVPDFTGWYVNCDEVSAAPTFCPGDVNGDGRVDVEDLLIVLANWGCQVG